MKFYTVEIKEKEGVEPRVSLVQSPAIQLKALMLSEDEPKEPKTIKLSELQQFNEERQIIAGPALIQNKFITRIDPDTGEEFAILLTKEEIAKFTELFVKAGKKINLDHTDKMVDADVQDVILVNEDKSNISEYNYPEELLPGDLFLTVHIPNTETWQQLKANGFNGFSIESWSNLQDINFKNNEESMKIEDLKDEIVKDILTALKEDKEPKEEQTNLEDKDSDKENKEELNDKDKDEYSDVEDKDEKSELEDEPEAGEEEVEPESEATPEMIDEIMEMFADIQARLDKLEAESDENGEHQQLSEQDDKPKIKFDKRFARLNAMLKKVSK